MRKAVRTYKLALKLTSVNEALAQLNLKCYKVQHLTAMARKLPWNRTSESSPSNTRRKTAAQSPGALPSGSGSVAQDDNRDILQTPISRRHAQRVLDSGMDKDEMYILEKNER